MPTCVLPLSGVRTGWNGRTKTNIVIRLRHDILADVHMMQPRHDVTLVLVVLARAATLALKEDTL